MIASEVIDTLIIQSRNEKFAEVLQKTRLPIIQSKEFLASKEKPLDIIDLQIGKDGGLLTYLEGAKEPIRGFPDTQTVRITIIVKKLIPLILGKLGSQNWLDRIITAIALYRNFDLVPVWFQTIYHVFPILSKPEHYSQPVKELRRVLEGKIDSRMIDMIACTLEADGAYKYRFQDIIGELKKENGLKEVKRLLQILESRDDDKNTQVWNKVIKLSSIVLLIPKFRKLAKQIIEDINIDEVKFSKEDIYWTNRIPSYPYRGLSFQERTQDNIIKYGA